MCWSVKGGSGSSVVAALLAVACARLRPTVLLDGDGDQPSIFGVQVGTAGLCDWWQTGDTVGPEALLRLSTTVSPSLELVPSGRVSTRPVDSRRIDLSSHGMAIADAGTVRTEDGLGAALVTASCTSVMVLRPCYLAARRAAKTTLRINGLVIVEEPGRVIRPIDISDVVGVPILATIPWDFVLTRKIDAGRLGNKLPRSVRRLETLAKNLCEKTLT